MAFDGNEGEFISMELGSAMTKEWREGGNGHVKAMFYGKDKLDVLLGQNGAQGLRIYFGEENGEKVLVLVAADCEGNDITNKILERGMPCPPDCGSGSGSGNGLNGNS